MSNQKNAFDLEVTFASRKAEKSVTMQFFHDLPYESQVAVIRYGAQRFINDKLGGSDLNQAEAGKKFDGILDQLREGWIDRRGTGSGATAMSLVERKMQELARDRIRHALKAKGIKLKDVKKEKLAELVQGMITKDEKALREQAEKIVEMESASLDLGNVDLASLDL